MRSGVKEFTTDLLKQNPYRIRDEKGEICPGTKYFTLWG